MVTRKTGQKGDRQRSQGTASEKGDRWVERGLSFEGNESAKLIHAL
jgi:hypothetical protein